jgi:RNA polymerase sigma-70 factor (family 1)
LPQGTSYFDAGEMLRKLVEGDHNAFDQVYYKYRSVLYGSIMGYVKDVNLADDILQIVFVNLWEKRKSLAGVVNLDDYLFAMVRNTVVNQWKRAVLERRILGTVRDQLPFLEDNVTNNLQEKEYRRIFEQAVSQLPAQQYRVYVLATEEKFSYDEIAANLKLSKFTVKRHLELARQFVRTYMNRHFTDFTVIILIWLFL